MITPPELVLGTMSGESDTRVNWKVIKSWPYTFKDGEHCKPSDTVIACAPANLPVRLIIVEGLDTLYSTIVPLPGWPNTEAIVVSGHPLNKVEGLPCQVYSAKVLEATPSLSTPTCLPPGSLNPHGGPNDADISSWRAESCLSL